MYMKEGTLHTLVHFIPTIMNIIEDIGVKNIIALKHTSHLHTFITKNSEKMELYISLARHTDCVTVWRARLVIYNLPVYAGVCVCLTIGTPYRKPIWIAARLKSGSIPEMSMAVWSIVACTCTKVAKLAI